MSAKSARRTVLIAGASGLVGAAAVEQFVAAGWPVVAVSRRAPEVEAPPGSFRHLSLDLESAPACRAAAESLMDVSHIVFAAVREAPGLVSGWSDTVLMRANEAMLRNLVDPLVGRAPLQHIALLQGGKAYGLHLHPIPVPARERFPRDEHPNFYWLQEDYVRQLADEHSLCWTILRPRNIVGPSHGVAMNELPVVGAYAAICNEIGRPFGFPGGAVAVWQSVDVRLLGRVLVWAATSPEASNEHFNVTNGEPFSWRDAWPYMADELGMEVAADLPTQLGIFFDRHEDTWTKLVQRYRLRCLTLKEILGESHHLADFSFNYGNDTMPSPALVSTIKLRQAGFDECMDTELSIRHWLRTLVLRRVVPGFSGRSDTPIAGRCRES